MDDFSPDELRAIEQTTQEVGRSLFARLDHRRPGIWDRRWWDDRIMQWAMADESVKVQMFRFIDVLPMLRTNEAIAQHLHEYFEEVRQKLPAAARLGLDVATVYMLMTRARKEFKSALIEVLASYHPSDSREALERRCVEIFSCL